MVELKSLAAEYGFAHLALCAPEPFDMWRAASTGAHKTARNLRADPREIAPWAKAICVLAAPYPLYKPAGGVSVAAYYAEYNAAHARAGKFMEALAARGAQAAPLEIPLKPAAERAGLGAYGRNGLIAIPGMGSCAMLKALALGAGFELDGAIEPVAARPPSCPSGCSSCVKACPTGALSARGFDYVRCLRAHMLEGPPVPEELRAQMGGRLLGCEECLRACPHNAGAVSAAREPSEELKSVLDVRRALDPCTRSKYLSDFGRLLGHNLALPNRVLAQAILVAANLDMRDAARFIAPLAASPSPAVREHARWALEMLKR